MQPSPDSGVFHSFSPQPDNLQTLLMSAPPPLASAPLSSAPLSYGPEVPQPSTVVDAANVRKDCSRKRARSSSRAPPPQRKRGVSTANRKDRKKEQNKTAALRYRQKKREEKNTSEDRLQVFEDKNRLLKNAVASLEAEIGYLTNLWKEVEKARTARWTMSGDTAHTYIQLSWTFIHIFFLPSNKTIDSISSSLSSSIFIMQN